MTDADITQIIADLKGTNRQRINAALGKLQNSQPTARRAEVAKALEPILEDKDFWTRKACIAAIGVWGTKENVPGLLKLVADENVFIRRDSITALGKLQDERAAEPIAKRLTDFGDRGHAAQVLRQIGSKAEKAVIPYLSHSDWGVRMEACHILKDIGTKDSKPELEKAVKDSNGSVAGSAKEALTAISARP
jgi:HEAT repeat protein